MFEPLESRRLFSQIPLLLYPCPSAVATAAQSIINAAATAVVASAGQSVASGQAPSQAMLDVIEYHEGYSLSIYPDLSGVPTVGIGLKLDSRNASFATAALNAAGVSYSDLAQDWSSIKSLWVSQHHPLADLKDTSSLWAQFVSQNPSMADPVLTASQASAAFNYAVSAKLTTTAAFFGSQFYMLDRDPQIALVDVAFHVANITKYKALAVQIEGNETQYYDIFATDYNLAAKQITPPAAGSHRRALDDQELMKHGDDPTSIDIPPSVTFAVGHSATLQANPENAFGQIISLPPSALKWTKSVAGIISLTATPNGLELHALRLGTINMTVTDSSTSTSATASVTVAPPGQVTWQASGTHPDVDGTFSATGKIQFVSPIPNLPALEITAVADLHNSTSKRAILSIQISTTFGGIGIGQGVHPGYGTVVSIALGSDVWESGSVDITTIDDNTGYLAGTFMAGPNDLDGQVGSIFGSFSGTFNL